MITPKTRRDARTCQLARGLVALQRLLRARLDVSSSCCIDQLSTASFNALDISTDLNGCSALKRFDMVGFEKGTFDSSFGDDPVTEPVGLCSIGLPPF